ncbi:MAG: HIT domain-containing protein [Acidobacteriia bacterium]|nr:HIT domain-containing protein [Terriglobia bacterium]
MDHLWSPWRYQYVTTEHGGSECIFCRAAAASNDEENLVVYRGRHNFIVLNRYPYTSGHLMIVPYQHVDSLEGASQETLAELIFLAQESERRLREIYKPDGLNLGMNLGQSAGAGIAGHIHLHVLPRWTGDTSFITTVSETRILPEELTVTYQKLSQAFKHS